MTRDDSRERKIKKKKSKKSRSRSRSRSRDRKRARSRSRDRRSRSRGRKSRSRSRRRSRSRDKRSRDRRSRSRSRSRDRKSRRSRSRSRKRSSSRGRRRSGSRSKKRSRSDSRSRSSLTKISSHKSREASKSPEKKSEMQLTIGEEMKRQRQIADIESNSFSQQTFRSDTRTVSMKADDDDDAPVEKVTGWELAANTIQEDYSSDTASEGEQEKKEEYLVEFGKPLENEQKVQETAEDEKRRMIAELAAEWDSRVEESKRKHKSLAILIEAKEEEKQRKQELNMRKWSRADTGAPISMNEITQEDPSFKERFMEDTQTLQVYKSSKLLSKTKAKIKKIDQERAKQMEAEAERLAAVKEQEKVEKEEKQDVIGSIHEYANLMGKSVKELAAAKYEPPEESSSEEESDGGDEDGNLWGAILGGGGS